MKGINTLTRLLIGAAWFFGGHELFAQLNTYEAVVCPTATQSTFLPSNKAPKSHPICDSGTRVSYELGGDVGIVSSVVVDRKNGDPHPVELTVNWVAGQYGTVTVDVYYDRRWPKCDLCAGCEWQGDKLLYSYRIRREAISPGGSLLGTNVAAVKNETDPHTFSFTYNHAIGYERQVSKIKYHNGTAVVEQSPGTPVTVTVKGFGEHTVTTQLQDDCGDWYAGPSQTMTLRPTCYADNPALAGFSLQGEGIIEHPEGFEVVMDNIYTLSVHGVTDFSSHYYWNVTDGGEDIEFGDNTLEVNKGLGSYRIDAVKRENRSSCPAIPSVVVFVGGSDITVEQVCPITIPDQLPDFGYELDPNDIVLEHFAATIISKRGIIVKPGVTLSTGAELIFIQPDPVPPSTDPDLDINFVQELSYDDYGRVISAKRSYFDQQGRNIQTQLKNLTADVMLANAHLFDSYGRQAITTLAAPVRASTETSATDECGDAVIVGEKIQFEFKQDFVANVSGAPYDFTNFDLAKENNPDAVGKAEGTVGWYYSTNNGSSSNPRLNEPLAAATDFPYFRTLFHHDGTDELKGVTTPGDAGRAGGGHVAFADNEPVSPDDEELTSYLRIRSEELKIGASTAQPGQFFRAVSIDENGSKAVAYTDHGGKQIISLYFGKQTSPITKSYKFYDDLGRLLVAVSPNGVDQYEKGVAGFSSIDKTVYTYNFKGWVTSMTESDAGTTEYIYRKDGKIRFSQNAEQRKTADRPNEPERYSYTNYDIIGRPVESGEYVVGSGGITYNSPEMQSILDDNTVDGGLADDKGTKRFRIRTFYDFSGSLPVSDRVQRFLHGSVSYVERDDDASTTVDNITTWYSYDERQRIEWMIQKIEGLGIKTIDYRYGPTGAVQEIIFQKGVADEQFTHFLSYDKDGRLATVSTTQQLLTYDKNGELTNPEVLELQATYTYYLHGPLKRIVYSDGVQGIDYTYTSAGTLKSINDGVKSNDPGGDVNDAFGITLDYYTNDYQSADYSPASPVYPDNVFDRFNGIIKGSRWHSPVEGNQTFGYAYEYDERYQFRKAQWGQTLPTGMDFTTPAYQETLGVNAAEAYDRNGNINDLVRANSTGVSTRYRYHYEANTNRLERITNPANITDELFKFKYSRRGQMTEQEDIKEGKKQKVEYDVSGKVVAVRDEADRMVATFRYDDRGHRLAKISYDEDGKPALATWYIRDVKGQIVSTYEDALEDSEPSRQVDVPVYGLARIGTFKPQYGFTFYEIVDHLGNVRAVIGDRISGEFMATMETERAAAEADFDGITSAASPTYVNHTPASVTVDGETTTIDNPNEVIRINNGCAGCTPNPIGGGMLRPVYPGDKIVAEVYVKYANFDKTQTGLVTGLAAQLATSFGPSTLVLRDGRTVFQVADQSPFGLLAPADELNDNAPKAFLNYQLFDRDFNHILRDEAQVSTNAEIPTAVDLAQAHQHERLTLEVTVEKEGFIYVYVSNVSDQNVDVYFDDLRITHEYSAFVAGNDYYPFGMEIPDRRITREPYRFGYQGQYSEKDDETGWNHFQFREFDPELGRWTTVDPKRQYASPYIGMGNNPVSGVDPTGGFKVPIHQRIMRNAAQGLYSEQEIVYMERGVAYTDAASDAGLVDESSYLHFDGLTSYAAVVRNYDIIQGNIDRVLESPTGTVFHVAFYTHAIQDFYSHSNYVELYMEYFPGYDYTTFAEVLSDESGWFDMFKEYLRDNLITGEFNLWAEMFGKKGEKFFGYDYERTHAYLNKDKVDTEAGRVAELLATRESQMILKRAKAKGK
jgi:RHS repeat-associated protein